MTTYGLTYNIDFPDSTLSLTYEDAKYTTPLNNGISKFYVELGYTKVMENNFLFGISVYHGIDFYQVDNNSKWQKTENGNTTDVTFDRSNVFRGIWFLGLKFKGGMVITPDIAIKGIFEVNETLYLSSYVYRKTTFAAASAIGIGLDYAITDNIILGLGAKYKLLPQTVELNQTWYPNGEIINANKNEEFTYSGNSIEIFAEISFKAE